MLSDAYKLSMMLINYLRNKTSIHKICNREFVGTAMIDTSLYENNYQCMLKYKGESKGVRPLWGFTETNGIKFPLRKFSRYYDTFIDLLFS